MKFTITYTRLFMETVDEINYEMVNLLAEERVLDIAEHDFGKENPNAKETLTVYDVEEGEYELFSPEDPHEHVLYRLRDPRDRATRYIGVTTEDRFENEGRLKEHMGNAEHNDGLRQWIEDLSKSGLQPLQERILSHLSRQEAYFRETRAIHLLLSQGTPLLNKIKTFPPSRKEVPNRPPRFLMVNLSSPESALLLVKNAPLAFRDELCKWLEI